jgi:hypothetical protein
LEAIILSMPSHDGVGLYRREREPLIENTIDKLDQNIDLLGALLWEKGCKAVIDHNIDAVAGVYAAQDRVVAHDVYVVGTSNVGCAFLAPKNNREKDYDKQHPNCYDWAHLIAPRAELLACACTPAARASTSAARGPRAAR